MFSENVELHVRVLNPELLPMRRQSLSCLKSVHDPISYGYHELLYHSWVNINYNIDFVTFTF